MKKPVRVAVTGPAGNIGYALLFRIAAGDMLGPDQPVILQLLERNTPESAARLKGVMMELADCAFPLLADMTSTADPMIAFKDADAAILVGARPRTKGMERSELLESNGAIFTVQGKALDAVASRDVKVLVVGNPCNTNCWIAKANAPDIPADRWFSMTALDENRAKAQLAQKAGVHVSDVTNMTIWGNHSSTQYPDFYNAKICGKPVTDVISDENWLKNEFIPIVQKRGAAIIAARGLSSAASAANAAIQTVHSIVNPTKDGDWFSVSVCSDGSYGTPAGTITSLPIRSDGKNWEIVKGLEINEFSRQKIKITNDELLEEQRLVKENFSK